MLLDDELLLDELLLLEEELDEELLEDELLEELELLELELDPPWPPPTTSRLARVAGLEPLAQKPKDTLLPGAMVEL